MHTGCDEKIPHRFDLFQEQLKVSYSFYDNFLDCFFLCVIECNIYTYFNSNHKYKRFATGCLSHCVGYADDLSSRGGF